MSKRLHRIYSLTERLKIRFADRLTGFGKLILIVICISLFFGLNVQRTMIYQVFTSLFCLFLFSYLSTLRCTTGLKISRKLPETCVAGRPLTYTIQLQNPGLQAERGMLYKECYHEPLPDWREFKSSKEEGEDKRNIFDRNMKYYRWLWLLRIGQRVKSEEVKLPEVLQEKHNEVKLSLLPLRRGNMHLLGYFIIHIDPFGLCKRQRFVSEPHNLLVLPKIYDISNLFFEGSRKYHQGGIVAALNQGDSSEFLCLREYTHGDPIKHIDWKSTARSGKAIVKQYRDEYFSRYGLILDSFTEKRHSELFEEAVSIAASIAVSENSEQSVLDLLFVGHECVTCSVGSGLSDRRQMMEILASVSTCRDKEFDELAGLVKSHSALLSGVVVILIDIDEGRRKLINFLVGLNIPVKAILLVEDKEHYEKEMEARPLGIVLSVIDVKKVEEQVAQI